MANQAQDPSLVLVAFISREDLAEDLGANRFDGDTGARPASSRAFCWYEMRAVAKGEWLELVHKLSPKKRLTAGVHGRPRAQSFRSLQERDHMLGLIKAVTAKTDP
jgi:hypothetical protein